MNLPYIYLNLLYNLYNTTNIEDIVTGVIHPLESYIIRLSEIHDDFDLRLIMTTLGMQIDTTLKYNDLNRYIFHNILNYADVLTNKDILDTSDPNLYIPTSYHDFVKIIKKYPDTQLLYVFGQPGNFDNRINLFKDIYYNLTNGNFMIFSKLVPTPPLGMPSPYLTFGTPINYVLLSLDQLTTNFINLPYESFFRRHDNPDLEYSYLQLIHLRKILYYMRTINYSLSESINQLVYKLNLGLIRKLPRPDVVNVFIKHILELTDSTISENIKNIFINLFYIGMYLKKWKGPGYDYPVNFPDIPGNIQLTQPVSVLISTIFTLLDDLPTSWKQRLINLPQVDFNDFIPIYTESNIFDQLRLLSSGNECINLNTRYIILSSYYYLCVVYTTLIYDFDVSTVAFIS